ncbi:glycosyltransferase family 2 protein [Fulvivirgaceae bacterium BMA10]|uniref:Glycosyltransferase family 2 protein n=1 Tax=Splendidivirga corallicola TaxID=3051826 RepID=A0ABT8KXE5_9BACT|nr:glycosyltransferase family 2 protein [Fulvivirgaceae bacterium BMA10]
MESKVKFSVIVPVYNSENTLKELFTRLKETFVSMNETFEVIFVNDHSRDSSYPILREIFKENKSEVTVIDLLRNYGQHNAIMCGFNYANGEFVITIDDDLQNPPQEIPELYEEILKGFDAVFGVPNDKQHKKYKNLGSHFIRRLNHKTFNIKDDLSFSSYRMIRKEIVDEIKDLKTPFPYISGMILTVTRSVSNVTVAHNRRQHGQSNYTLSKLIRLAFNLLINYSSIPLRYVGAFGLVISILSFLLAGAYIFKELIVGNAPPGWTTLVVLISFYNSVILVIFFILGEYISRMLRELSNEKQYSIRRISEKEPNGKLTEVID